MFSNIPEELKALQQWVCFDIVDGKKIPYTPGRDSMAASNRSSDWRSFRSACKDVERGKRQHIGFCFSSMDPFVFIDLDDPEDPDQIRILERSKTYCQRSISGKGYHLICKGTFQGAGKHPAHPKAGMFKEGRFCLMTGDIYKKRSTIKPVAEADLQAIHDWLGGGKDAEQLDLVEYEADLPDQTVFDMGKDRFLKFEALCCGQWQQFSEYGNDHSTADHAFIAMLCDLTESNDQVRWFFHASGMWNEERAAKKAGHGATGYVDRTIRKVRSEQAKMRERMSKITLTFGDEPEPLEVMPTTPAKKSKIEIPENPTGSSKLISSLPKGLIRDIAEYSFKTSFYPLQEASVCVALTFLSGVAGRAFLTSTSSGLNLWPILVGGTSCGKEEFQSGIGRLVTALEKRGLKSAGRLFGGEIASGQAIEQIFADRKRYIAYFPEFGDMFKTLANPYAPDYIRALNRSMLNSFNAANRHGSMRARRKAAGIEGEETIERPCLVIAGEATPESLYGAMTTRELATGFLQRFLLVNVPAESWSLVENPQHAKAPPHSLLQKIEELILVADGMEVEQRRGQDYLVVEESPEAAAMLHDYRTARRREAMLSPEGLAQKELITRAGVKILRIASLLAVSADFHTPRIEVEHAKWAIRFVEEMDKVLLSKFSSGEVGSGQTKQEAEIVRALKAASRMDVPQRRKMGMSKQVAMNAHLLPLFALKELVVNSAAFATDRNGAVTAFEKCVESMCKTGKITKIDKDYSSTTYGHDKGILLCYTK